MMDHIADILAVVALMASMFLPTLLIWLFVCFERNCKSRKNPNWEVEIYIRRTLDRAEALTTRTGFEDLLEEPRLQLASAIVAAKAALAPETKIAEASLLQEIYESLMSKAEAVERILPSQRYSSYDLIF